jgi:hypothetical protein
MLLLCYDAYNVTIGEVDHFTEISFVNPTFSLYVPLPCLWLRILKKT